MKLETLEGRTTVLAALHARQRRIQAVLIRRGTPEEKAREVVEVAEQIGVPTRVAEAREIDALTHGASHGGIVALATPKPRLNADELLRLVAGLRKAPLLLLLEGIEDARNLGFTLRAAEALGAHAVLIKKHIWDLDATEISRPSSGAYERLPLAQIEDTSALTRLQRQGLRLFGCLAAARKTMFDRDLAGPAIVAVGGEKRGLSGAVREICDGFMAIPTIGGASSLPLAHAASIILAEAFRQRRGAMPDSPDART